jgi:hypothetical protein
MAQRGPQVCLVSGVERVEARPDAGDIYHFQDNSRLNQTEQDILLFP